MKKLTTEEFIEKSKKIHGDKYDYSKVNYINGKSNIIIICSKHGKFTQRGSSHLEGRGCNNCVIEDRRNGLEDFITNAKEIHGDKYNYSLITEYKTARTHVSVICKNHGEFKITPYHHVNRGQGCAKCKSLGLDEFIKKAKKIHGDKYDYSKSNYTNNKSKIDIICPTHGKFSQRVGDHINQGCGCPNCNWDELRMSITDFVNKANKKHNYKYQYLVEDINFKNNKEKVVIICPIHGKFKQKINTHLTGGGCPICNESKGEKEIRKFLEENKINYKPQHKFNDCKYKNLLPFDFYLPDYNICIEFNGSQHYEPIKFFGGKKIFDEQVIRDEIKIKYCKNNNIPLIIIKHNENPTIILNNLFDGIPIIT
jgi:hypothetical protein